MPNAWERALERFEAGYGDPVDLTDLAERAAFLAMLEDEVRSDLEAGLSLSVRRASTRMAAITSQPPEAA